MSRLHVANYQEARRYTAIANATLQLGEIIKIVAGATAGTRYAARSTAVGDVQKTTLWGVVMKISSDAQQVASTTASAATGDRTVTIASGDAVVQVGAGAVIEYHQALLHDSLDPDRGGVTPLVGDSLGIATSGSLCRWTTAASTSYTNVGTTIHVGRVFRTFGKKVLIQLVEQVL
jgi:hypothetical protein